MSNRTQTVGFIGLGLMGIPMAKNIVTKGFSLVVYNRTIKKTLELKQLGATVASSPLELAQHADIIITMVTNAKSVEEVLFGKQGAVLNIKKHAIVIDMSTIGPTKAKEIGTKLREKKIAFLDAPVTGSTPKAISGELTIFIGGEMAVFEKAKPVLSTMGTNLQYMGPMGSGQAIKLINNYFLAACTIALSEGMLLADSLDLPRSKMALALSSTPNISPTMKLKLPGLVNGQIPLLFSMANMFKDLQLAKEEVQKAHIHLPGLLAVEKLYNQANKTALTSEDFSAIIKYIEKNAL